MTVAGYNTKHTSVVINDPAADLTVPVLIAPAVGLTILNAYVACSTAVDADGSNHIALSLLDGGADGTGTTALATFGGASVDYGAGELNAMTVAVDAVDGGDHIMLKYDETGTVAPGRVTLVIEWTAGGS
jgi:hypothetical protein